MAAKKSKKKKKKAKRKSAKQPVLTKARVKAWGFECDNMTEAAVRYKGSLVGRLKRSGPLRKAWDRGRFLRDISNMAAVGMTKAEVAVKLAISLPQFEMELTDPEAGDIWTRAQIETLVMIKTGVRDAAIAGKTAAIKSYERILQEERPASAIDIYRMTIEQMCVIADVTRQTLHKWVTDYGLSRNSDATFDLRVFVKWFEGFSQRKVNTMPQINTPDENKAIKTARLKRLHKEEMGKLVSRDSVIAGLVGRIQWDNSFWDRNKDSVADKCKMLPTKESVIEILDKYHDQRRSEMSKADIEMKLTEKQIKKFEGFLKELE